LVTLDYRLHNGDIVEIITTKAAHGPSRDWLNIVRTNQAREKIRAWFKRQQRDENIAQGKEILDRELRRLAHETLVSIDADKLLELATQLKEYVDKTDENMLSLDVIKKAEEIEKLSKSVKEKMKAEEYYPAAGSNPNDPRWRP